MSSILKALKKLEKESPQREDLPSLPGKVDTREVIHKRVKGPMMLYRLSVTLSIVVLAVLAGWAFWTFGPVSRKADSPAPETSPIAAKEMKTASVQGRVVTGADPGPAPEEAPVPQRHAAPPNREMQKVGQVVERVPPATGPEREEPRVVRHRGPDPVEQGIAREPLDASRFKLEAIVWASNPESRFAVINGRIIRTGGEIEEVSVKEIGRDYVALDDGERECRLTFTIE